MSMLSTPCDGEAATPAPATPMPRILLVATLHFFFPARFALALTRAGCDVEVACPPGHLFGRLSSRPRRHTLRMQRELLDLETAIRRSNPTMVIPCDDRAYGCLQSLNQTTRDAAVRHIISESSSPIASSGPIARKGELIRLARELGLPVPATRTVSRDVGPAGFANQPFPVVLKRDGTWAGNGVRIAKDNDEACRAWQELIRPPSPLVLARQVIFNGLHGSLELLFERPLSLDAQEFIAGRAANRACLFKDGIELAGISAVAHQVSVGGTGPSSVINIIDHADMTRAAQELGRALNLNGFFGFDFVLSEGDGRAYLLETNPRITPLSTIAYVDQPFLPEKLYELLTGCPPASRAERISREAIAIFPDEWARDPASPLLSFAHHDVPWSEPSLVIHCLNVVRRRKLMARWLDLVSSAKAGLLPMVKGLLKPEPI
jgi:predicted ATP-grasp superfamily ATP-dependent carboligase